MSAIRLGAAAHPHQRIRIHRQFARVSRTPTPADSHMSASPRRTVSAFFPESPHFRAISSASGRALSARGPGTSRRGRVLRVLSISGKRLFSAFILTILFSSRIITVEDTVAGSFGRNRRAYGIPEVSGVFFLFFPRHCSPRLRHIVGFRRKIF